MSLSKRSILLLTGLLSTTPPVLQVQGGQLSEESKRTTSAPGLYVEHLILEQAPFLRKREQAKLMAPYLRRSLSALEIEQFLEDIRDYYMEKGYPTVQVQLAQGQKVG